MSSSIDVSLQINKLQLLFIIYSLERLLMLFKNQNQGNWNNLAITPFSFEEGLSSKSVSKKENEWHLVLLGILAVSQSVSQYLVPSFQPCLN